MFDVCMNSLLDLSLLDKGVISGVIAQMNETFGCVHTDSASA